MTDSTKTTEQSQQSSTNPWAPTQGLLTNLISSYGGQNTGVTGDQSTALSNLLSSASSIPSFMGQAGTAIGNLFNTNNSGQVGTLANAYGTQQSNLGGIANPANLDPYKTPGFSDAINTATNDITNQVKSVYAGSGRDPSGAGSFAQSLGRGLTQGIAPTIANQYNSNVGNLLNANSALMSGASNTAGGINALNQQALTNGLLGINAAGALPGLATGGATARLGAANAAYSQPYANLAALLQPSIALAGLGGQSSGSGTSTQTSTPSLMDSLSSGLKLGGSFLGGLPSLTSGLSSLFMLSDRRAKTGIRKVGALASGPNVYQFKYKGTDEPKIGLIAQDVEKHVPEAVGTDPRSGLKMVDYAKAIRPGKVGALKTAA